MSLQKFGLIKYRLPIPCISTGLSLSLSLFFSLSLSPTASFSLLPFISTLIHSALFWTDVQIIPCLTAGRKKSILDRDVTGVRSLNLGTPYQAHFRTETRRTSINKLSLNTKKTHFMYFKHHSHIIQKHLYTV